MIRQIKTVDQYDQFIRENPVAVVHFGFQWNSFDRTMQRTLTELKPEFGETVQFGYVDVDQNATIELLKQINLVNVPTLVYFKDAEQQLIQVGMRTMDDIRAQLGELIIFDK